MAGLRTTSSHRPAGVLLKAAISLVIAASGVVSQDSNVQSCIPGLEWLLNSKGHTPCLTASYLESTCRPMRVDAIPAGTHYLGPQTPDEANECLCSTVVYSLVSACGACQGRNWAGWARWSTNCSSEVTSLGAPFPRPIPPAAEVPRWAYMDIPAQVNQSWSPSVAFSLGSEPLTSSTPPPANTNAPSDSPPSQSSSGGGSNAGAIAGGVVGGVVFLVLVGLFVFWFFLRKRKDAPPKDLQGGHEEKSDPTATTNHYRSPSQAPMLNAFSPPQGSSTLPSLYGESPMAAPMEPPGYYASPPRTLNMSDTGGSVMPMSPGSAVYTTLPSRRSYESLTQSQPSQFGSLVSSPPRGGGGYTGAAEPA